MAVGGGHGLISEFSDVEERDLDGRGLMEWAPGVRGRERKGKGFLWERVLEHRRGFFASRMLCYSQPPRFFW